MLGLSNPELGVLMLALFVVFIMFGFPIAFTLMALGVLFGYFAMGDFVFPLLVQRSYSVMTSDVLISIPLFVFMGYIIERANILDRLFRSLQLAAGPIPASLALATLATCAIFATATGIVGAVVTLMGLLAFPAMLRAGYDVKIASGVICAGGCLGILIPPSVMLILYGATAGVSVVKLYAGAFFPGIMLAGLYMLYTVLITLLNPKLAPQLPPEERNVPFSDGGLGAGHVVPAFVRLDRRRARLDRVRAGDAVRGGCHGLARCAPARGQLRRGLFAALGVDPDSNLRRAGRRLPDLSVRVRIHRTWTSTAALSPWRCSRRCSSELS